MQFKNRGKSTKNTIPNLAYRPLQQIFRVVQECWSLMGHLNSHLNDWQYGLEEVCRFFHKACVAPKCYSISTGENIYVLGRIIYAVFIYYFKQLTEIWSFSSFRGSDASLICQSKTIGFIWKELLSLKLILITKIRTSHSSDCPILRRLNVLCCYKYVHVVLQNDLDAKMKALHSKSDTVTSLGEWWHCVAKQRVD